jgi:hypothetical protein
MESRPSSVPKPALTVPPCTTVANGSFELTNPGSLEAGNISQTKWTPTIGGAVVPVGGIPTGPGPRIVTGGGQFYSPPDGTNMLFMQYVQTSTSYPGVSGAAAISQDLSTLNAQSTYILNFCQAAFVSNFNGWDSLPGNVTVKLAPTNKPDKPIFMARYSLAPGSKWIHWTVPVSISATDGYTLWFLADCHGDESVIDNISLCPRPNQLCNLRTAP